MKSELAKRTSLLTASNLLLQIMGFAYRIALTSCAGTEALGLNSLIMQIYSIVVSICISGLSVAVTSCAARLTSGGMSPRKERKGLDPFKRSGPARFPAGVGEAVRGLLKKAVLLYCLLWLAAALPIFLLRFEIAENALNDPGSAPTLALMLVCIFMTGLENVLKSVHLGSGLVGRCAASELTEQGVRFLLVIKLLSCFSHERNSAAVFLIMLGMTASELVSVSFLSASFARSFGFKSVFKKRDEASGASMRELVSIAAPASATALASTVFASAAALLLPSRLVAYGMSYEAALSLIGVMSAVAVPITMIPMAAVSALSSVLMPETAARVASGRGGVKRMAIRAIVFSAAFGAAAAAILVPAAPYAAQRLFGVTAQRALFAALAIKAAVIYPQAVSVAVLNGAKQQKTVLAFAVLGELYQLIMMLLLTPVLGIMGYAAAMIAGEALRLACNIIAVSHLFAPEMNSARVRAAA